MLTEARLVRLILYVRDLAVSRRFYEGLLGFRVLEEDAESVRYSAGHLILCLQRAADHGITLREGQDRSIDITFLVSDFAGMRDALESRGVQFSPTLDYAVGKTVDFYDPDGHWFSLYEPSEAALGWPSGEKIRTLRSLADANPAAVGSGLDGHDLVYLFLFVRDLDATQAFYHKTLGLEAIEGGPCKRVMTSAPVGVVKYDVGGTLLTTHHVEGNRAASYRVTTRGSGGVALAFHVPDVRATLAELSLRAVELSGGVETSGAGTTASFADPAGHLYQLYTPSAEAGAGPEGAAIQRILAAPLRSAAHASLFA
jgi:catechol 2,3-dioxygenase-like lactoylglutathione lyase family enzyme